MSKKAVVFVASGFEEIETVSIVDVLRRAGIEVVIAGVDTLTPKGANGIEIKTDASISAISSDEFDIAILPGGYGGTMKLCEDETVQKLINEFDLNSKIVAAICAAPLALDRAGVLKDNYTCYPGVEESIKSSNFVDQKVVESGNIITSRGPGTAICFALYLVEKLLDKSTSDSLKKGLMAEYC